MPPALLLDIQNSRFKIQDVFIATILAKYS